MNNFIAVVVVLQVLSSLVIIGLVLLQHGKGADMGAAFGSGASGSLFGATGSSNFLSKSTGVAAAVFFAATLALTYLGAQHSPAGGGVMDNLPAAASPTASGAAASVAPTSLPAAAGATQKSVPAASAGSVAAPANSANQIPK